MKATMTPKERIRAALAHQTPDRVPTALWGSYYTLNDDTYFAVLKHLGLGDPLEPFRREMPRNSNYYDDRVLDALDTDVRYVWSRFTDLGGARMSGDRCDAWGVEWQRMGPHITSVGAPLSGLSVEEIEAYPWPDVKQYIDLKFVRERTAWLRNHYPDHAIGARAVNSYGPFEQASVLRGREDFYVDMITGPEVTHLIVNKVTDAIIEGQELYIREIAPDLDFLEIPGDDYGGVSDLMISPDHFREYFKPALARIVSSAKAIRPDLPIVFHTDGAIAPIIPDFIEIGIDVLNPLEPLDATDWPAIKKQYGHKLAFMGGVDLKGALTGTLEDVAQDVRRCVETFAEGGGYILTSANHMQADIPPENIVHMFASARRVSWNGGTP